MSSRLGGWAGEVPHPPSPTSTRLYVAGAYGSTKRYKSFERLYKVNDCTVLGASGELSDYQYIKRLLEELADDDFCLDDGHHMKPHEIFSYLTRVIYNRRNKCAGVVGGMTLLGWRSASCALPSERGP